MILARDTVKEEALRNNEQAQGCRSINGRRKLSRERGNIKFPTLMMKINPGQHKEKKKGSES